MDLVVVAIDSATVTVFQQFDLHAGPDTTNLAPATSVQLHADGAVSYSWQPSASLSDPGIANPVASPSQNTTYYLRHWIANAAINLIPPPLNFFPHQVNVTITPHDTANLVWVVTLSFMQEMPKSIPGSQQQDLSCVTCPNPVATPKSTIIYTVIGTDTNGCSAGSDSVKVEVNLDCSHLVIPSAFSPNNDGRNEFLHALSKGVVSFNLKLYNRWGILVFSSRKSRLLMGWKTGWKRAASRSLYLGLKGKAG